MIGGSHPAAAHSLTQCQPELAPIYVIDANDLDHLRGDIIMIVVIESDHN